MACCGFTINQHHPLPTLVHGTHDIEPTLAQDFSMLLQHIIILDTGWLYTAHSSNSTNASLARPKNICRLHNNKNGVLWRRLIVDHLNLYRVFCRSAEWVNIHQHIRYLQFNYWAEIKLSTWIWVEERKTWSNHTLVGFPCCHWTPLDQMPNASASIINLTVSSKLSLFVVPFYKWETLFLWENVHNFFRCKSIPYHLPRWLSEWV